MSIGSMLYGAALSAVLALIAGRFVTRERRPLVLGTATAAAFLMPLCWNEILRITHATANFSHDLAFPPFPISWQDAGSGVFTLAGAAAALAFGPSEGDRARHLAQLALTAAIAALLIDIYTY